VDQGGGRERQLPHACIRRSTSAPRRPCGASCVPAAAARPVRLAPRSLGRLSFAMEPGRAALCRPTPSLRAVRSAASPSPPRARDCCQARAPLCSAALALRARARGAVAARALTAPASSYAPQDKSLLGADPVVWYTFAFTHFVRPEDYPVMPCDTIGFRLSGGGVDWGWGRGGGGLGWVGLRAGVGWGLSLKASPVHRATCKSGQMAHRQLRSTARTTKPKASSEPA
jgi:hypothetical protein